MIKMNTHNIFSIISLVIIVIFPLTILYFRPTDNIITISYYIMVGLGPAAFVKMLDLLLIQDENTGVNYNEHW